MKLSLMIKHFLNFSLLLLFARLCYGCNPGLYSTASGSCQQCDISCSTCSSSDGCSTCYDQMYLVAKGNLIVCEVCYLVNKGCDICLTATKCLRCEAQYFLESDNTCIKCDAYFPNCLICMAGNSTDCQSCISPYRLINGECIISNLTNAQTFGNQLAVNSNSATQITSGTVCDQSEILLNGACFPSIAFCLTYNQINGSCIACISFFELNNGYCLPSKLMTNNNQVQTQNSLGTGGSVTLNPSNPDSNTSAQRELTNLGNSGTKNCASINSTDPTKCLICAPGYTIVDAFPGICYPLN